MKRIAAACFITGYLGFLGLGIVSHGLRYGEGAHPLMYFVVWDMFCGWSAYSSRSHLIAEGESGTFYRLTPTPWGEYHPYAHLGRQHYDSFGNHLHTIAANVLRHTRHEPIRRVIAVEETWAKKYNLPDAVWQRHFSEPKRPFKYYHVTALYTPQGQVIDRRPMWVDYQASLCVADNPRLLAESRKTQPAFALTPNQRFYNPHMAPLWERAFTPAITTDEPPGGVR